MEAPLALRARTFRNLYHGWQQKVGVQMCVQASLRENTGCREMVRKVCASFPGLWGGLQLAPRCVLGYKPDPQTAAFKLCRWTSFRERQRMGNFACFSVLSPDRISTASLTHLFVAFLLFAMVLWVFGMQSSPTCRNRCFLVGSMFLG